jgi:hypothetical protein
MWEDRSRALSHVRPRNWVCTGSVEVDWIVKERGGEGKIP